MPRGATKIMFGLMAVLLPLFLLATFSLKNEIIVDNRSLTAQLHSGQADVGRETTSLGSPTSLGSRTSFTTPQKSPALISDAQENSESRVNPVRSKTPTASADALAHRTSNRVNILLLGMSGPGYEAPDLTDTILVLSVDPKSSDVAMISLPRDLYVEVPETESGPNYYSGYFTKINALYQLNKNSGGSEEFAAGLIKEKTGQITGLEIDNYVLMDLEGLKEIIDQIGGLNVFVEKDVFDPRFPAKNFGTEVFELKKGWRWLDGETALRYVRTRHDIEGDFGRLKRQQAVVEALRKKIVGMNPLWDLPKIIEIVQTLRRNFKTDLDVSSIKRLWDISRKIDSSSKIKHIVIDPVRTSSNGAGANQENGLLEESTAIMGGKTGFILIPKIGLENYEEIHKYIKTHLTSDI